MQGQVSTLDSDDPAAREARFTAIRAQSGSVEVVDHAGHINDPAFATAAEKLLELMARRGKS